MPSPRAGRIASLSNYFVTADNILGSPGPVDLEFQGPVGLNLRILTIAGCARPDELARAGAGPNEGSSISMRFRNLLLCGVALSASCDVTTLAALAQERHDVIETVQV